MKTVHALIVAIDNYPIPAHRLNGCVNDATEFANYIKSFAQKMGFAHNEKRLFDADAKRLNIVEGFKIFDAANANDICIYYYSGHGSQMKAPAEFWDETDGMSETIVCYDSRLQNAGCRDMADKEIAFLIHKATADRDVHFLAVTDCCHSGSNTRDFGISARMAETCPTSPRGVEEYVGFKEYVNFQPPSAKHIHLAAAKDDETAKELKINNISRGVFTYSLIETLQQSGGNLNYAELMNRVALKCRNRVADQTPILNAYLATDDVHLSFLGETQPIGGGFVVSFDNKNGGWTVNCGGAQGLNTEGAATFKLDNGMTVSTAKIGANSSKLNGLELLDQATQFSATLVSMPVKKVRIAVSKDSEKAGATALKKAFQNVEGLQLVDNEKDTDYVARAWDGKLRLTTVDKTTPLFRRVAGYDDTSAATFADRCATVANWKNKLELANPTTSIQDNEVLIQYFDANGNAANDAVFRQPNADESVNIQLSVTNRSNRALWVSTLLFGADFSISNKLMRQKFIKPGETAWIESENSKNVPLWVQAEYQSWGVNELTEYFKIFVSTDTIDTDLHNQDGLPLDEKGNATREAGVAKGILPTVTTDDWRTFERSYRIICPLTARELSQNSMTDLGNIQIFAPKGFSAKASLSTSYEAKAALDIKAKTRGLNAEPTVADSMKILRGGNIFSTASLAEGMGNSPMLDVLELENPTGSISKKSPLKVQLSKPSAHETVLPLGYDAESGLYFPVGFVDKKGLAKVHILPPSSETTRGLFGSYKIFFKKMTSGFSGEKYNFPMLRIVDFDQPDEVDSFKYDPNPDKKGSIDLNVIAEAVKKSQRIGLFIHGIIGTTGDLPRALRRPITEGVLFQNPFDLVLAFDYESLNTPIEKTAADLKACLEAVGIKENCGKRFEIIAHSMGGLVSRWFVERLGGASFVHHLTMLGTPNAGSEITDLESSLTGAITLAVNGATFLHPWLLPLNALGKFMTKSLVTVKQQQPSSSFMAQLNSSPDVGVPYHIVVGNTKLMEKEMPEEYSFLHRIISKVADRKLYMLFDFYFGEPNDLAVRVESIKSAGMQTKVTRQEVACDHFAYFDARSAGIQALSKAILTQDA